MQGIGRGCRARGCWPGACGYRARRPLSGADRSNKTMPRPTVRRGHRFGPQYVRTRHRAHDRSEGHRPCPFGPQTSTQTVGSVLGVNSRAPQPGHRGNPDHRGEADEDGMAEAEAEADDHARRSRPGRPSALHSLHNPSAGIPSAANLTEHPTHNRASSRCASAKSKTSLTGHPRRCCRRWPSRVRMPVAALSPRPRAHCHRATSTTYAAETRNVRTPSRLTSADRAGPSAR